MCLTSVFQALVGEKACYQSVSSYAGQIVYLGTKVLCCICIFVHVLYVCLFICSLCVLNSCELPFLFVDSSLPANSSTALIGTHLKTQC